ncbi:Absent in melanoma 1-like protein [Liparis tanakae]|uniref:Absent in melanoma 1-like protein n=1 Tax=Liparis tanakae TaxID=230148 RepID=A0A4Z2GHX3_9TELE|nr:Absent in melanoma 1-like protein [Liparis tanakae]
MTHRSPVDRPPRGDEGSLDEMNSGYSSLSTKLSIKTSPPPKGDESLRFRKVSLISDAPEEHVATGAPRDEWRRSLLEWEEPAAPAGAGEAAGEAERFQPAVDAHRPPVSAASFQDDDCLFTGVFQATLVDLVSEPAAPSSTPPASPDSLIQSDMESLVDTLKNMGPSMRPRNNSLRGAPPALLGYSLAPIVEDAFIPPPALKGLYDLPGDLGLKRSFLRDTPLELMKQKQEQPAARGPISPLRASLTNNLGLRRSSDSSPEELKSPLVNGNGASPSYSTGSRLDNSVLFGSHRSASVDQTLENGHSYRPLFRSSSSLPDKGPKDRMSSGKKELGEAGGAAETPGSRFDRFSFLLSPSPSSSLSGLDSSNARMSRAPPLRGVGTPPSIDSPIMHLPSPSLDLPRPFITTDSAMNIFGQPMGMGAGPPSGALLQRSFSAEGPPAVQQNSMFNRPQFNTEGPPAVQQNSMFNRPQFNTEGPPAVQQNSMFNRPQFSAEGPPAVQQNSVFNRPQFQSQEPEPEKNLESKYRAFPDAYLTKEKEHGKLNPRPGKIYIFDRPGMCGQRIEVRSDVMDATAWELQETISIRVMRGGWVLYEKPNFKGEKFALDEGDMELAYPFSQEQPLQNGEKEAAQPNGGTGDAPAEPARKFIIGSLRRAVRDYSVPEISLFPEENAEGKKVTFRDTSEDARIFGFPIKANSIIINAGLWLVYAHPFFQGLPRVLEVGGFPNPAAWGVEQPYVGSLHPLKVGEPRVENLSEPKMVIYDKPYFSGKSRIITANMRDFMARVDQQQTAFMYNIGSLKIQGGIWVGYEKEGFRGHQYLLEEGEYQDWRVWGGRDAELRSARLIRADLTDPTMVMFEQPEEEQEGGEEENTFEVTEAIPDVELFEYRTSTRSIHVLSGAWIAYSHVDYSGNQYILEKGFYNNFGDWGSQDTRICSVQPIRLVLLYPEPDFQGECHVFKLNQDELPEKFLTKSCRVSGSSWVLYEDKQHTGNMYILSEGDYPNLTSMGCPTVCNIRSVKVVPMMLSVPSVSLFGHECLEGREITMDSEVPSLVEEGFNNHIMSIRVNSGCWVICEHGNYRGRQFLLEPVEIINWPKFSSIQTIGSMFPVRQKRRFLRIKNTERGHFLSVQGGVEEMKSGRVVVSPEVEPMSDIWFYQDGFIKSKVMGTVEPAAKVVLWAETRQPIQTWTSKMKGHITSLTFPGCVLDVKGGKTYDKDHVVIMPENEERPSQQWEIELV